MLCALLGSPLLKVVFLQGFGTEKQRAQLNILQGEGVSRGLWGMLEA